MLPKLRPEEKRLLADNNGCFKCRHVDAFHVSRDCKLGYPKRYYPVNEDAIREYRAAVAAWNASRLIATARVAAATITSDTDDNPPLSVPHFFWNCLVDDPASLRPAPVEALLDNGSHTVLIDQSLRVVDRLQLRVRNLPQKLKVSLAMNNDADSTPTILDKWVKITPQSADRRFTSKVLKAVVAPQLAVPLILGQPFLKANKVTIDHDARTCIIKDINYDLLSTTASPSDACPQRQQQQQRRRTANAHATANPSISSQLAQQRQRASTSQRHTLDSHGQPPPHIRTIAPQVCNSTVPKRFQNLSLVAAVGLRIQEISEQEQLQLLDEKIKAKYIDRFPSDFPHARLLNTDIMHRFKLINPDKVIKPRIYSCPKHYLPKWKTLLDQHLAAGRIRPSNSPYVSPSFIIPKKDPTALPRWVNDYRELNSNTVPDRHPLPRIDDVISDCGKGKFWAKLDMTNSFFQTVVPEEDRKYTAVTTPWGLYEWTVMPMGCRNAPATHQRRMFSALRDHIGRICHVYLDDIIIWSSTLKEHIANVQTILSALRTAGLFVSDKKTQLFLTSLDFLGHHISRAGVEASDEKVRKILDWPVPKSATEVRSFLGLVRYISQYLPHLAEHTAVLTPLTTLEANKLFPVWTPKHQAAFQAVKDLVVSRQCLTVIDHENPDNNLIFVTTDVSDVGIGAVLSFGKTWEGARPVAFESVQLSPAEQNYPVHEKELLAIVHALKKWRSELLGIPFLIKTDHRTLEKFMTQRDLSHRQVRWQEELSQYEFEIQYIPGDTNTVADALSRRAHADLPESDLINSSTIIATTLAISTDEEFVKLIKNGYKDDTFCAKLLQDPPATLGCTVRHGLLFLNDRLVIPRVSTLRKRLFHLAHDSLGHFGADKSYAALRQSYYWPNMRRDLETGYIKACNACQRYKSATAKKSGPLHPLPVPDARNDSVAIDFVGPLPEDKGL